MGVMMRFLVGAALLVSVSCGGSSLHRLAVVNDIRAEGLNRIARLEKQWFEAGVISRADHTVWVEKLTLAALAGRNLTQAIRFADEGAAFDAIAEILEIVKVILAPGGLVARLPPELVLTAQSALDLAMIALSTMQLSLEASHDPTALDPSHLALVYLPDQGGDLLGDLDRQGAALSVRGQ